MRVTRSTKYEELPDLLTPTEAAAYLGIHVKTVREYIQHGRIRAARNGRHYLIRKQWLLKYLEESAEMIHATHRY